MGTDCLVVTHGPRADVLAADAEAMIAELERSWSRFVPTSELSRLNRSAGGPPVAVSRPTFDLVGAAVEAWRLTAGRFDPTVLEALVASGYDATFDSIGTVRSAPSGAPSPGPVGIDCDPIALTVRLPEGVSIDLGGIGKGRAADLVAGWLMDRGVDGVCVDLGGDVALVGRPEPDEAWVIGVAHPLTEDLVCSVRLSSGAVATSTTARRRWATTAGPAHHLIDPATGRPVETDVRVGHRAGRGGHVGRGAGQGRADRRPRRSAPSCSSRRVRAASWSTSTARRRPWAGSSGSWREGEA